jgi:hypothetical protein
MSRAGNLLSKVVSIGARNRSQLDMITTFKNNLESVMSTIDPEKKYENRVLISSNPCEHGNRSFAFFSPFFYILKKCMAICGFADVLPLHRNSPLGNHFIYKTILELEDK